MYQKFTPKPTSKDELKAVLVQIWNDLPMRSIKKAVVSFRKRLQMCIEAEGRHIDYVLS